MAEFIKGIEHYQQKQFENYPAVSGLYVALRGQIGIPNAKTIEAIKNNTLDQITDDSEKQKIAIYRDFESKLDNYISTIENDKKPNSKSLASAIESTTNLTNYVVDIAVNIKGISPDNKLIEKIKENADPENLPEVYLNVFDDLSDNQQDKILNKYDDYISKEVKPNAKFKDTFDANIKSSLDIIEENIKQSIQAKKEKDLQATLSSLIKPKQEIIEEKPKQDEIKKEEPKQEETKQEKPKKESKSKKAKQEDQQTPLDTPQDDKTLKSTKTPKLTKKQIAEQEKLEQEQLKIKEEQLKQEQIRKQDEIIISINKIGLEQTKQQLNLNDTEVFKAFSNKDARTWYVLLNDRATQKYLLDYIKNNKSENNEDFKNFKDKIDSIKDIPNYKDQLLLSIFNPEKFTAQIDSAITGTDEKVKVEKKAFDDLPENVKERLRTVAKIKEIKDQIIAEKNQQIENEKATIERERQLEIDGLKSDNTLRVISEQANYEKKIEAITKHKTFKQETKDNKIAELRNELNGIKNRLELVLNNNLEGLNEKYDKKLTNIDTTPIPENELKQKAKDRFLGTKQVITREQIKKDKLEKANSPKIPLSMSENYLSKLFDGKKKIISGIESETPKFNPKYKMHDLYNAQDYGDTSILDNNDIPESKLAKRLGVWVKLKNENAHAKVYNGKIIAIYGNIESIEQAELMKQNNAISVEMYIKDKKLKLEQDKFKQEQSKKLTAKIDKLKELNITKTIDNKPIDKAKSLDQLPRLPTNPYSRDTESRETQLSRFNRTEKIGDTIVKTKLNEDGTRSIKDIISLTDETQKDKLTAKDTKKLKETRLKQFDLIKDKDIAYRGDKNENGDRISSSRFYQIEYDIDGKKIKLNVKLENYTPKDKSYYKLQPYHRPVDMDEESKKLLVTEFGITNERDFNKLINKVYDAPNDNELLKLAKTTQEENKTRLNIEQQLTNNARDMIISDFYKGNPPKTISSEDNLKIDVLFDNFMRRAKTQGKYMSEKTEIGKDPFENIPMDKSADITKIHYTDDLTETLKQLPFQVKMYKGLVIDINTGDDLINKQELIRQTQAIITKHYNILLETDPIKKEQIAKLDVNSKELNKLTKDSLNVFIANSGNTYIKLQKSSDSKPREEKETKEKPDDFLKKFNKEMEEKAKLQEKQDELDRKIEQDDKKRKSRKKVAKLLVNKVDTNNYNIKQNLLKSNDILSEIAKLPINDKRIPILQAKKRSIDVDNLRLKTENALYTAKLDRYNEVLDLSGSQSNIDKYKEFDKARKALQSVGKDVAQNDDLLKKMSRLNDLEREIYGTVTDEQKRDKAKSSTQIGLEAHVKDLERRYEQSLEIINEGVVIDLNDKIKRTTGKNLKLTKKQKLELSQGKELNLDLANSRKLYDLKLVVMNQIVVQQKSLEDQKAKLEDAKKLYAIQNKELKDKNTELDTLLAETKNETTRKEIQDQIEENKKQIRTNQSDIDTRESKIRTTIAGISDKSNTLKDMSYVDLKNELDIARSKLEKSKQLLKQLQGDIDNASKGISLVEAQRIYDELKGTEINGKKFSDISDNKTAVKLLTTNVSTKDFIVDLMRRGQIKRIAEASIANQVELARYRNQAKLEQYAMLPYAKKLLENSVELQTKTIELQDKYNQGEANIKEINKLITGKDAYNPQFSPHSPKTFKTETEQKLKELLYPKLTNEQIEKIENSRYVTERQNLLLDAFKNQQTEHAKVSNELSSIMSEKLGTTDTNILNLSIRDAQMIVKTMSKYNSQEEMLLDVDEQLRKEMTKIAQDNQQDVLELTRDLNQLQRDSITLDTLIKKNQVNEQKKNIDRLNTIYDDKKRDLMKRLEQQKQDAIAQVQNKVLEQKSLTDQIVNQVKQSNESPISSISHMLESGITKDIILNAIKSSSSDRPSSAGLINYPKKNDDGTFSETPIYFNDKPKNRTGDQTIEGFRKSFLNSVFTQIIKSSIPTKPEDIEAFKLYHGINTPTQDIIDNIDKYKDQLIKQFLDIEQELYTKKRRDDAKGVNKDVPENIKNATSMFTNKFFSDISDQAEELHKQNPNKYSDNPVDNQNAILAELLGERLQLHLKEHFNPILNSMNIANIDQNAQMNDLDRAMQSLFTYSTNDEKFKKLSAMTNEIGMIDQKAKIDEEIKLITEETDKKLKFLEDEQQKIINEQQLQVEILMYGENEAKNKRIREKAKQDYLKFVKQNKPLGNNQSFSYTNALYELAEKQLAKQNTQPKFSSSNVNQIYVTNAQSVGENLIKMNAVLQERYIQLFQDNMVTIDDIRDTTNLTGKQGLLEIYGKFIYDVSLNKDNYIETTDGNIQTILKFARSQFKQAIDDNKRMAKNSIAPIIIQEIEKQYSKANENNKGIMALLQLYGDQTGVLNYADMPYLQMANERLSNITKSAYEKMYHKVLGIYATIPTISPELAMRLSNVAMQKMIEKLISEDPNEVKNNDHTTDIVDTIYNILQDEKIVLGDNPSKETVDQFKQTKQLLKDLGNNRISYRELFDDASLYDDVLNLSSELWVDAIDTSLTYDPRLADQRELKRLLQAYHKITMNNDFNKKETKDFFDESAKQYVDYVISFMDTDVQALLTDPQLSNGSHQSQLVTDLAFNNDNTHTFTYNGKEYTLGSVDNPDIDITTGNTVVAKPDAMVEFINKTHNINTMKSIQNFTELTNTLFTILDSGISNDERNAKIQEVCSEYMEIMIQDIVDSHRDIVKGTVLHSLAKFNKSFSNEYVESLTNMFMAQVYADAQNVIAPRVQEFMTRVNMYMNDLSAQTTLGTNDLNIDRTASKQDFLRQFILGNKDMPQDTLLDLFKQRTNSADLPTQLRGFNIMDQYIREITKKIFEDQNVDLVRWELSATHIWQGGKEICEIYSISNRLKPEDEEFARQKGLGLEGLYSEKLVPMPPHANCRCYLMPVIA